MIRAADLVLGMEQYHLDEINRLLIFRCKYARLLGSFVPRREYPEIDDPYGVGFEAYQLTAEVVRACMPGLIDYIGEQVKMRAS